MNAIKMKCLSILWLFSLCINAQASTHWMVTETGLIQPRIDSPFEMARPYDLLAFLNQDTRWDNIINLYHELHKRQHSIDNLWAELERAVDFNKIVTLDEHCVKVGQLSSIDWYTSFLEDGKSKGIVDEEYMLHENNYGDTDVPDCKKLSSLTFSMFAFEHLQGMIQRENLTANPELSLPEQIAPIMTIDPFGHWLATILKKNSSSWLHYNMASLYWRVRGNAPKALECSRRAVHYAPREYKDIALLSMGSILHRSKMPEDALIILGAATDHDSQYPYNHFALANVYAIVGEYNSSIKHFEECLDLNPTFELAMKHKNAVLCHIFFRDKIKHIEQILNKLREELSEFNNKEVDWLKSQAAFLRTMKHAEEFDYRDVEKNCVRMTELTGLNINELKHQGDQSSLIKYFLDSPMYDEKWFKVPGVHILESAQSIQRLVNHINKQAHMVSSFVIPSDQFKVQDGKIVRDPQFTVDILPDKGKPVPEVVVEVKSESLKPSDKKPVHKERLISEFDTGVILYPPTMKINRYQKDFDVETDWPSNKQCKDYSGSFPENVEAIYPTFLPFENKGLSIRTLLTDKIGVPASTEHELPWHPPVCPNDKEAHAFTQKKGQKPQFSTDVVATKYLKEKLLEYAGNGDPERVRHMQEAEIGQRIYAAMQMKLAPKWLLYTLSSLYWRVRNNNVNALHCLLSASRTVETKYKDIVLASLASVYVEMGYFDDALTAAEEAFRLSLYEPATNFVLAELNMLKKHRTHTHMFHLKQVVRVEPRFMEGLARGLLVGWACLLKQVDELQELEFSEGDICTQMEPGISMVCEKDGSNCHVANIHCFSNHERVAHKIIVVEKNGKN